MDDKFIERDRYDKRAMQQLSSLGLSTESNPFLRLPAYLRDPYDKFVEEITERISKGDTVLEICAGTGEWTGEILKLGAIVCATDISPFSVDCIRNKFAGFCAITPSVADMERLPFASGKFDFVVCAGGLSYGDNLLVLKEIHRVLKMHGEFICVDSFNHNPIYKLNRYVRYILGNRSKSTLIRMPTMLLLEEYKLAFGRAKVNYYGSITHICGALSRIIGDKRTAGFSRWVDAAVGVRKSAFKFVMVARKVSANDV